MKSTIISIVLVLIMIISSVILFTIYGQNARQNELDEALSVAVEQSLENLKLNKSYSVNNTDEFIADFLENLILSIESDSEVKVEILGVDVEKGLLDVNVVETFVQPNGSTNTVTCRKTVILEEYSKEAPRYHLVQFMSYAEGSEDLVEFKTYSICEGSFVIVPKAAPTREGYEFKGWSLTLPSEDNDFSPETVNAEEIEKELKVNESLVFFAVFAEKQ